MPACPLSQTHGEVPDTAIAERLRPFGYDRSASLPAPPNTDIRTTVHASSSEQVRPLVRVRITHTCKATMSSVGDGPRRLAARTADESSALLEMLIEDVRYDPQPRLQSHVETWYGGKEGDQSLDEQLEHWSQKMFHQPFADLEAASQTIIMTALEGALCYPKDEQEWEAMQDPLSRLFEGTPSILAVLQGGFDSNKAGKNIRQSDRGE